MIIQLQLDIYKGVPGENGQHKFQEEYEALAQGHGGTKGGLLDLREDSHHGYQMQRELTRTPMNRKALPFT